jgi:hypothetical protein
MMFEELELVALKTDLPDHGLRKGDVGTVVMVFDADNVEVEFVEASGDTRALLTLSSRDVRKLAPDEMLSARSVGSPLQ